MNLTKKTTKYEWTDKCEEASPEVKKRLTSAPVLTLPREENTSRYIVMHRRVGFLVF